MINHMVDYPMMINHMVDHFHHLIIDRSEHYRRFLLLPNLLLGMLLPISAIFPLWNGSN